LILKHGWDAVKAAGIAAIGYPGVWAETNKEVKLIEGELGCANSIICNRKATRGR